jgi:Fe-S-cluster-containing hydrogenase component 2
MVPYNKLFIPKVTEEYCIGCGACEFACPTKPFKAIYVEGNYTHKTAKKNVQKKVEAEPVKTSAPSKKEEKKEEKKPAPQEDFPF